ncbi:hypothetical protein CT0861_10428, partial [Colletotrichum tofieldiae]
LGGEVNFRLYLPNHSNTMPTRTCANASCFQYITALESRVKELESLVASLSHESQTHPPCDTTALLPTIAAAGSLVPPKASYPLSPAPTPPRCPDLEPQSPYRSKLKRSKPKRTDSASDLVQRFVDNIPRNEQEWQKREEKAGLINPAGVLEAFGVVASSTFEAKPSESLRERFSNHIVKRSEEMKEALCRPNVADDLLAWGPVIFSGECRVALQLGVEPAVVDNAMRQVLDVGRSAATRKEKTEKTLEMYRTVPVWITRQMDGLYDGRSKRPHRAFQIFPLARMTIAMYDKLSKPRFKDEFDTIRDLLASDCAATEQTSFPLYPPFIVWAIIRLKLGEDCFEAVCHAFDSRTFLQLDFETWYALLPTQSTTPTPADKKDEATMGLTHHKRPLADVSMPEPKRKHIGNQGPPLFSRPGALDLSEQAVNLPTSSDPALSCDGGDTTSAWDNKAGHTLSTQDPFGGITTAPADTTHPGSFQHAVTLSDSLPVSHDADGLHVSRGPAIQSLHTPSSTAQLLNYASGAFQPLAQNEPPIEPGVQVPLEASNMFRTSGPAISPYSGDDWSRSPGAHHAGYSQMGYVNDLLDHTTHLAPGHMAASGGYLVQANPGALDEQCVWTLTPLRTKGDTDVDMFNGLEQTVAF